MTIAVILTTLFSSAQEWCTPGAKWTYSEVSLWSNTETEYTYLLDTFYEGRLAHKVEVFTDGYYLGEPIAGYATEYTAIEDGVLWLWTANIGWDTLIWFSGQVGDRWWPIGDLQDCAPEGMRQIGSFGTTVIDGVALSTVNVLYINAFGVPCCGNGIPFIDRIGSIPRIFRNEFICGVFIEYPTLICMTYEDDEISYSTGMACSVDVEDAEPLNVVTIIQNPSTTLQLAGIGPQPVPVRLVDNQGSVVLDGMMASENDPLTDEKLPPGSYLVELFPEGGRRHVLRWVKE